MDGIGEGRDSAATRAPGSTGRRHGQLKPAHDAAASVAVSRRNAHLMSAATALGVRLFVVALDDLASLAPLEVIRVDEGVAEDDHVEERRGAEVEEVPDEILHALEHVSWQPETDAEGVDLRHCQP